MYNKYLGMGSKVCSNVCIRVIRQFESSVGKPPAHDIGFFPALLLIHIHIAVSLWQLLHYFDAIFTAKPCALSSRLPSALSAVFSNLKLEEFAVMSITQNE
jgi:hypothetical protein